MQSVRFPTITFDLIILPEKDQINQLIVVAKYMSHSHPKLVIELLVITYQVYDAWVLFCAACMLEKAIGQGNSMMALSNTLISRKTSLE